MRRAAFWAVASLLPAAGPVAAQWTHRYPKVAGLAHHVYLEGYDLPTLANGPLDPAPAPDGRRVAIASRGWLWILDLTTGVAERLTRGAELDSRPAWSPDGKRIAFVRDNGRETRIAIKDLESGDERVIVTEPAIVLDPAFAPDGGSLFYSSASAGDLDVWRMDLGSGAKTRVTTSPGNELKPVPLPDGRRIVYLAKRAANEIRLRDLTSGDDRVLASGAILSMLRPAPSPDGRLLAINWPTGESNRWELRLLGVDQAGPTVLLTAARGLPLTPAWSADGKTVFYSESSDRGTMELFRIPAAGGDPEPVRVSHWAFGVPTARLVIGTTRSDQPGVPAPARIAVRDGAGHALIPDDGQPRFDGQNGIVFFYSAGRIELEVPVGPVEITAVQGLPTPPVTRRLDVARDGAAVDLALTPAWDARAAGWLAGEHHFHLNYGGPFRLTPDALAPMARAEAMDVLTPLVANLHTRFEDQPFWNARHLDEPPFIAFGQEVRAHFFGHVGLIGIPDLFWPWIWGPGYEIYSRDDRPNRVALEFGRRTGGVNMYVHPVVRPAPFDSANLGTIPVGFIPDLVQGFIDLIEVACLWSDETGTMDLWYRALNLGVPLAPSAGTDVMNNFYRTMAAGTTRVYVRSDVAAGFRGYLDGLRAGRSFVTNGPMLDFRVGSAQPGDVVPERPRKQAWKLDLRTAVPVSKVEIVVNGAVVATEAGLTTPGARAYGGSVDLPAGGWIAARAIGGATERWPAMDSYAFAHTAPIWIGARGSTTPAARRTAARDLLRALDVAEQSFKRAYEGTLAPELTAHYARARERLNELARE